MVAKTERQPNMAQLSAFRRTLWPSREAASTGFAKSAFYKAWDPRVLERWIQHGLRDVPTPLHPEDQAPQVTLTTTPAQEVFTFLRPNFEGYGVNGKAINRSTHADIDTRRIIYPFHRAEPPAILDRLPGVRPSVLYVFGSESNVGTADVNADKVRRTGVGVGGSGGVPEGRVSGVTFEGIGHLIPMEASAQTADAISEWVGSEMVRFRKEQLAWNEGWKSKPLQEKQRFDEMFLKMLGGAPKRAKL